MSNSAVEEVTVTMQSEEPAQMPTTAGAMLRQAREAARMQLPSMAATLKVPQHKLEALEADDYASFPDHVFMRALAMGMCRVLHIESEPVLALLPRSEVKSLAKAGPGINAAVKDRNSFKAAGTPLDSGGAGTRKIVAGVLILLVAAAVIYFVPLHPSVDNVAKSGAASTESVAGDGTVSEAGPAVALGQGSVSGDTDEGAEAAPVTSAAPEVSATQSAAGASASAGQSSTTPVQAAPVVAAPAANASATTPASAVDAATASSVLSFKVINGQSWIRVKDSAGKTVLEKTLLKDDSITAQGSLPLSVTVGNAKGTQVLVRGEPLDISTTRDNVARFEVK